MTEEEYFTIQLRQWVTQPRAQIEAVAEQELGGLLITGVAKTHAALDVLLQALPDPEVRDAVIQIVAALVTQLSAFLQREVSQLVPRAFDELLSLVNTLDPALMRTLSSIVSDGLALASDLAPYVVMLVQMGLAIDNMLSDVVPAVKRELADLYTRRREHFLRFRSIDGRSARPGAVIAFGPRFGLLADLPDHGADLFQQRFDGVDPGWKPDKDYPRVDFHEAASTNGFPDMLAARIHLARLTEGTQPLLHTMANYERWALDGAWRLRAPNAVEEGIRAHYNACSMALVTQWARLGTAGLAARTLSLLAAPYGTLELLQTPLLHRNLSQFGAIVGNATDPLRARAKS